MFIKIKDNVDSDLSLETGSLCSPDWDEAHYVDQVGQKGRDQPAYVSQVLGVKACGNMPGWTCIFNII